MVDRGDNNIEQHFWSAENLLRGFCSTENIQDGKETDSLYRLDFWRLDKSSPTTKKMVAIGLLL